jgi:hypothetical protein
MTKRHCWSRLSRALPMVFLAMACVTASASGGADSGLPGLTDALIHVPPTIGPFAYNRFVPPVPQGASYVDPVFGTTVRRLTTDHVNDDIYARNMWWNADETRYLHRTRNGTPWPDFWNVIDVGTGKVTHQGIPIGGVVGRATPSPGDGGFDPVDPNVLYALGLTSIYKITLNADGTWTSAVFFTPPDGAVLKSLGGTLNWFDASGRYMLVRYGSEPSVYLYDRQNMAAGPYANPIDATKYVNLNGYIGITPDGKYLVGADDSTGSGYGGGVGALCSWALDHVNRSVAATRTMFWNLGGDHASFLSASDGRDYAVTYDPRTNFIQVFRADITNNAVGLTEAQQQALPNNKLLIQYPTWNDGGHMTTTARGPLQDWAFTASEDGTDTFNSGTADANGNITPWHIYRNEITAVNVITGEVRRLAHHRSRSVFNDYFASPRVSASWGGKVVGFASNFNQSGVNDIYVIPFSATSSPDTNPPTVPRRRQPAAPRSPALP